MREYACVLEKDVPKMCVEKLQKLVRMFIFKKDAEIINIQVYCLL